jgi:hypothetical protein
MKKGILMGLLVSGGFIFGTGTFAQENDADMTTNVEIMQEGAMQISIEPIAVEVQNPVALQRITIQLNEIAAEVNRLTLLVHNVALLQDPIEPIAVLKEPESLQGIAVQLKGVEAEVNRVSLLVNKVVLERQAVALQGQLNELMGIAQTGEQQVGESNTEGFAAMQEPTEVAVRDNSLDNNLSDGNRTDIFDDIPIPIVATEDDSNNSGGFLAGVQNALGNMGTPEIVTVLILAVLAIFVILRRVASRGKTASVSIPVNDVIESETQKDDIDEKRQEIQEKVAWK